MTTIELPRSGGDMSDDKVVLEDLVMNLAAFTCTARFLFGGNVRLIFVDQHVQG